MLVGDGMRKAAALVKIYAVGASRRNLHFGGSMGTQMPHPLSDEANG
jgi:hypothetical protein